MYDLTLGQNGHFRGKKPTKNVMCLSCLMLLVKGNIFLVNIDILIKLNLLKSHDLL